MQGAIVPRRADNIIYIAYATAIDGYSVLFYPRCYPLSHGRILHTVFYISEHRPSGRRFVIYFSLFTLLLDGSTKVHPCQVFTTIAGCHRQYNQTENRTQKPQRKRQGNPCLFLYQSISYLLRSSRMVVSPNAAFQSEAKPAMEVSVVG